MRLYDYAASGNCYKARLLLALLEVPYERVPVDIFAGDTLTPEFGASTPCGRRPSSELDSGETITQSNAILWYLAEGTAYLPADRPRRRRTSSQWLLVRAGACDARASGGRVPPGDPGRAALDPEADAARFATGVGALRVLDDHLADREFLVGDRCSIADLSVFAYTSVADQAGFELSEFPAVLAWIGSVRALPGFVDDQLIYPENARPGRGRSIYD